MWLKFMSGKHESPDQLGWKNNLPFDCLIVSGMEACSVSKRCHTDSFGICATDGSSVSHFVEHVNLEDVSMKGALSHPKALCSKVFQLAIRMLNIMFYGASFRNLYGSGSSNFPSTRLLLLCNK